MNALDWLSRPELWALTWALIHFVWQGTLIAVLLASVVRVARIERAAQRYLCSLAALLAMALCPVITYFAIAFQSHTSAVLAAPDDEPPSAAASAALAEGETTATVIGSVVAGQSLAAAARWAQPYVLILWLAGVTALAARLACGVIGVVRLGRHRVPLPAALAGRVEQLGKSLRIDALSRVFLSRQVSEALVVGFWRPVVLVPVAWATEMPLEALEAIIAHELAHLRRFDLWVNLLQRVVETLLFYHPAVWWVSRQLRLEREMCCDELAVAATGRPLAYVETLELVARERLAGVRPALTAGIRGETNMKLLARVRNVLGGPSGDTRSLWPAGVLALLLPLGMWAVTWGIISPSPSAAVAADDERDDDERDDDKGRGDVDRKEGDREEAEAREKREILRGFLAPKKEDREEADDDDDAPKKEANRKDGDEPKKVRKEGDAPRKELKEGDLPKKVKKEGEGERKEVIKKDPIGELTAMVKELRGEVEHLRAEVRELRGDKSEGKEGAIRLKEKLAVKKPEGAEHEALLKKLKEAGKHDEAEAIRRKEELKKKAPEGERKVIEKKKVGEAGKEREERDYREAVEKKLREVAEAKERAADRQAAERKERAIKEREEAERKEKEGERKEKERKEGERKESEE